MKININSADGNIMVALGYATLMLKKVDATNDEIAGLRKAVFAVNNADEARAVIEDATNGAIEFYAGEAE